MKKYLLVAVAALVLVPAALAADPGDSSAAAACRTLQKTAPAMFGSGKTYKNLGACVSVKSQQADQNAANAAKTCQAERADANFAGSHDGKSFNDFYGSSSNEKGKGNALGKCVSSKAKAKSAEQNSAELNAAKQCKKERTADPAAFKTKYGTNRTKSNAFGKCVAQKTQQP